MLKKLVEVLDDDDFVNRNEEEVEEEKPEVMGFERDIEMRETKKEAQVDQSEDLFLVAN